ncbi:MAG: bifunctional nuclease family protein [Acidimicrobiales bacterium]
MSDEPAPDAAAGPPAAPDAAPAFRVVLAESVTYDLGDAAPQMHLMEAEPPYRNLSVPIALAEAVALHQALAHVEGRRPGTHELTSQILARLGADVVAARIVRCDDGVYYAELDVMGPRGREVIDCRTSDAVILALRQGVPAPILCAEAILAGVG